MITQPVSSDGSLSLDELRRQSTSKDPKVLDQIAKQLGSFFFKMMMTSLQKANEAIKSDFFDNKQSEFYEQMYYQEIAHNKMELGFGLKELIVQQLKDNHGTDQHEDPSRSLRVTHNTSLQDAKRSSHEPRDSLRETKLDGNHKKTQGAYGHEKANTMFATPADFVEQLLPYAAKAIDRLAMKPAIFKKVLVAQAALETNFGQAMIRDEKGKNSFNLFGIKSQQPPAKSNGC